MAVNAQAVLNINVNDKAFKDFMANFDKYQKVLAQQPQAWKAMTKEQRALMSAFGGTVTLLQQQTSLMHKMAAYAKDVTHSFQHAGKHVVHMGHKMKEVGHHVLGITEKLMRWGGIAAGLVTGSGIAGLFGLDKLGDFVRRGAVAGNRVGMSMGSLRALEHEFGGNYGMDMKGVAQGTATAADDPTSDARLSYKRLTGREARDVQGTQRVTELMRALREQMKKPGMTASILADRYQTGALNISPEDIRAMSEESDKEFEYRVKHVEKGASDLDMKRDEIKKWQAFMTALEEAGDRLKTIIASYLTPILKTFTENSDKWLTELDEFLKSKAMKQFLTDLPKYGQEIVEFFKGFAEDLRAIGKRMGWIKTTPEEDKAIRARQVEQLKIPFSEMTAEEQKLTRERSEKARQDLLNSVDPSEWFKEWYKGGGKGAGINPSEPGSTAPQYSGLTEAITKGVVDAWKAMKEGFTTQGGPNLGGRGYQTGTDLAGIQRTGAYTLHKGEIVLPEKDAALLRQSGMADWKRAISGVESGGDYKIMNTKGSGATGKYQVMPFNIPSWTKKALGYSMTQEQFRNSPEAQERVFETIFGDYVHKFGNPIDAASAWFSGQPLTGNKAGPDAMGTTVPGYIKKFIAAMGGSGAGSFGGGGHMNLNINDNTGGNVALSMSNLASTGPVPLFPL